MQAKELEERFASIDIDAPAIPLSGRAELRIPSGQEFGIYIGLRRPSACRSFRLQVTEGSLAGLDLPRLNGLVAESERAVYDGRVYDHLHLTAGAVAYNGLFATLAADLISSLDVVHTSAEAISTVLDRLARWQRFLERLRPDVLSEEAQRGLFGELIFLRDHAYVAFAPTVAVLGWRGPDGNPVDFEWAGVGVEVKTQLGNSARVRISNEHQLDGSGIPALYLHCVHVIPSSTGDTLPELVEAHREKLSVDQSALRHFEDQLLLVGYLDVHASAYMEARYSVSAKQFFEISEHFPRIRAINLPSGLSSVQYTIDLSQCKGFEIEFNADYLHGIGA